LCFNSDKFMVASLVLMLPIPIYDEPKLMMRGH